MTHIATKIFELLDTQNKTQNEFAAFLGLSKQTISGWKNPKNKSYMSYIDKIALFFDVSTDYLLGRDEPLAVKATESEWTEILEQLSPESLVQLRDYTRYLLWKQQAQAVSDLK